MSWDDAEKYISHLVETYDLNRDGKFDYAGTFHNYLTKCIIIDFHSTQIGNNLAATESHTVCVYCVTFLKSNIGI